MSYVITTGVDIDAGEEAVWSVLSDFARYGEWSNFSGVDGALQVGSRLTVRMPGFSFRPTVTVVEPGQALTQRFVKRNDDNGYAAFNAGLTRQVEARGSGTSCRTAGSGVRRA